jgi:predicted Zn-dependent peptidase
VRRFSGIKAHFAWRFFGTKVSFEEYNLDNGLHVILQNDPSAPVVITSMYHVGAKNENPKELVLPTFLNIYY